MSRPKNNKNQLNSHANLLKIASSNKLGQLNHYTSPHDFDGKREFLTKKDCVMCTVLDVKHYLDSKQSLSQRELYDKIENFSRLHAIGKDAPCSDPALSNEVFTCAGLSSKESATLGVGANCENLITEVENTEGNDKVRIIKFKKSSSLECHLVWTAEGYLNDPQSNIMLKGQDISYFYNTYYQFFTVIDPQSNEVIPELGPTMIHGDETVVLSD